MPEYHHFNPNQHNGTTPSVEADVPQFASNEERDAYVEKVFAERQAARAAAKEQQAPALDAARQNLQQYFADNGRKRDTSLVNPPRIYRAPKIVRLPQIARLSEPVSETVTERIPIQEDPETVRLQMDEVVQEQAPEPVVDEALKAANTHLEAIVAEKAVNDEPWQVQEEQSQVEPTAETAVEDIDEPEQEEASAIDTMKDYLSAELQAAQKRLYSMERGKQGKVDEAQARIRQMMGELDGSRHVDRRLMNQLTNQLEVTVRATLDVERSKQKTMSGVIERIVAAAKHEAAGEELKTTLEQGKRALFDAVLDRDQTNGMVAEDRSISVIKDVRGLLDNPPRDADEFRYKLLQLHKKLGGMSTDPRKKSTLMSHLDTLRSQLK